MKRTKRPTTGDYLDGLTAVRTERTHAPKPSGRTRPVPTSGGGLGKVTFYVPADVVDELRGVLAAVAPNALGVVTLSELVTEALREKLALLRKRHHGGKPFAGAVVRKGRPPRG